MIERRGGARLAQQTLASFRGGSSGRQYFHCHFAMQFQIGGAVNNAHAAAADFTIKPVTLAEYRPGNDRAVDDFVATKDASILRIVTHLVYRNLFPAKVAHTSVCVFVKAHRLKSVPLVQTRAVFVRYFSLSTAVWWATCPARMYASARTVTGLPLAMPLRDQASSGKFRKKVR